MSMEHVNGETVEQPDDQPAVGAAEVFVEPEEAEIVVGSDGELVKVNVGAGRALKITLFLDPKGAGELAEQLRAVGN